MSGGTFRGTTRWDSGTVIVAAMDPADGMVRVLPQPEPRPFAQSELLVMLELVRAELVKLRLVLEQALKPRANSDDALDDIQRHWNVASHD